MWKLLAAFLVVGCTEIEFTEPCDDAQNEDFMEAGVRAGKSGGWSKNGSLFTKDTQFVPDPAQGPGPILPPVTIINPNELSLQADFPIAEYYTVQFAVNQDAALPSNPDITAEITWAVEGTSLRRVISVGNGTSISGTGAACNVKVHDTTITPGTPAGQEYVVNIALSPGVRPARSHPPYLRAVLTPAGAFPYVAIIPVGGFILVPIPVNSGIVSADVELVDFVPGGVVGLQQVSVQQLDGLAGAYKAYYPLVEIGFVPIFPSATVLRIDNQIGYPDRVSVTILFGVDG